MNKTFLETALNNYFQVLKEHGRTFTGDPVRRVLEKEEKFFPYLDMNDLVCIFCYKELVVLAIHVPTDRPHWGCLACRFEKGIMKIKWEDHCAECGKELHLSSELLEDQKKYLENDHVLTTCEECAGNANILKDEDMKDVHTKVMAN